VDAQPHEKKATGVEMNDNDWNFAIGDLGDPLADILWWMTPPHPDWLLKLMGKRSSIRRAKTD